MEERNIMTTQYYYNYELRVFYFGEDFERQSAELKFRFSKSFSS